MIKKFFIILLCLAMSLCFGLAIACNDNNDDDTGNNNGGNNDPVPTEEIIVSDGITFELINGTSEYQITKYEGEHTTLTVPDTIDGFAVTKVCASAFDNNNTVTELVFSDNIKHFEANSIYRMNKLATLTLPKNVETMHNSAILTSTKNKIRSITMPANAITKAWSSNNSVVKYVRITKGDIPDGIFSDQVGGVAGLYKAQTVETLIMDDEVTSIGVDCFRSMKMLKTLVLSNSLKALPERAFSHAYLLTELNIPEGVTFIGDAAFRANYNLREVTIPASVEKIDLAFGNCYGLNRVTIKEGSRLTEVSPYAFENCVQLFEIVNLSNLPISLESETYLGLVKYAKYVYDNPTQSNFSLNDDGYVIYQDDVLEDYYLMGYIGDERALNTLPADIGGHEYKIASYFIYNNTKISGVTIPANVVWIGKYAFACTGNVSALKRVTFELDTGWRHTANDEDSGVTVDVKDTLKNATNFAKNYQGYFWKR